jgi:hypothetical protein
VAPGRDNTEPGKSRPQELTSGLLDAVVLLRRGSRIAAITMRLDAAPGNWEVVELQY